MKQPDRKMEIYVRRLLGDEGKPSEMERLLIYLRDNCGQQGLLKEIGHFIAHARERDKGISTETARAFGAAVLFHAPRLMQKPPRAVDLSNLPECTPDYLRYSARQLGYKKIAREANLSVKYVKMALEDLVARLELNPDGSWALRAVESYDQLNVLKVAVSYLSSPYPLQFDDFKQQFLTALRTVSLISKQQEKDEGGKLATKAAIVALSSIHNSILVVGGYLRVPVRLAKSEDGCIHAFMMVKVPREAHVVASLFSTPLMAVDHAALLELDNTYDGEIEVTDDWNLAAML